MQVKHPSLVFAVAITLSGCAPQPAPQADIDAAMTSYRACLHSAAKQVDDRKSDAITIGLAIKPMCAQEFRQSVILSGQGMNMQARLMFERKVEGRQLEIATGVVLDERSIIEHNPAVTDDPLSGGLNAANVKDYATALRLWLPLAKKGNAEAQYFIATLYANGRGIQKDDAEAVKWFRKAAEQANADAQDWLGLMYATGRGISKDYVQAYKWFTLAAANFPASETKKHNEAIEDSDRIATEMTQKQIAEAQRFAQEWKPQGQF